MATPDELDKLLEWLDAAAPSPARTALEGERLFAHERLVVSPGAGVFEPAGDRSEGAAIAVGDLVGHVGELEVRSPFAGSFVSYIAVSSERVTSRQPIAWLRTD